MVEAQASIPDHIIMLTTGPIVFSQTLLSALKKRTCKVDLVVAFNVALHIFDCI